MADLSGFPYFDVQFAKDGAVVRENDEVTPLIEFLTQSRTTDLFVISHGWNNDMNGARGLYRVFLERVHEVMSSAGFSGLAGRKFGVMGVLWPSKRFAERELIPGGAASVAGPVSTDIIRDELDDLKGVFSTPGADDALEQAKALVSKLENSPKARREFVELVRSLLPQTATDQEDASNDFFTLPGDEVIPRLSKPVLGRGPSPRPQSGGTARIGEPVSSPAGGAANIGQFFSGIRGGALNLLNYATYYQMKERAAIVGRDGVNPVLRKIRSRLPNIKLHLVGHSFGARLVTAATAGHENQPSLMPNSLLLLQGAFSHHSFAQKFRGNENGFFRRVVANRMVSGPILISFTQNDAAVGRAYPLASLIAGQVAAELGDKNDLYGAIGRNGAQKTPEAIDGTLLGVPGTYQFEAGKVYNLNSDAVIRDHSDISRNEVAQALLAAVATT